MGNHHGVQKSKSFNPSIAESKVSMDVDLSSFDPLLIEEFQSLIHEYNTEIELTFGETINFVEKFAHFVNQIDLDKMRDTISIVLSKKQDVFLSETVNNTDKNDKYHQSKIKNANQMIDQKPAYVRSTLQSIYYSFLNLYVNDNEYKIFYETYYETETEFEKKQNGNFQQNAKKQKKSNRLEDADPFFQCFCECSRVYNLHQIGKENEKKLDLRQYLEFVASNILNVLRVMNGVIGWISNIRTNSLRLILPSSDIDISLYEFSQLLQCVHLQTQHAVKE